MGKVIPEITGSGNETAAHLLENGRITFMFCLPTPLAVIDLPAAAPATDAAPGGSGRGSAEPSASLAPPWRDT